MTKSKNEVSKFGNGTLVGSGGNVTTNVHTHFGNRDTGGTTGVLHRVGNKESLVISFDGKLYNDVDNVLVAHVIPAGSVIKGVYMDVKTAFTVGGTTPALEVGTDGSEATNGFTVSEAQLEATDSVNLTSALSGTWDGEAPLAADTTVGFALSGTSPTVDDDGEVVFTIDYVRTSLS